LSVGMMIGTGSEGGEPVSMTLTAMAVSGSFGLLFLAGLVGCVAMGMQDFRDWASNGSFDSVTAGVAQKLREAATSISTGASHFWAFVFPSRSKNRKPSFRPSA